MGGGVLRQANAWPHNKPPATAMRMGDIAPSRPSGRFEPYNREATTAGQLCLSPCGSAGGGAGA
jgi:hypothetical protein